MKLGVNNMNERGQLTIFIIIALVLVAGVTTFFLFRGGFFGETIPAEFRAGFDYYEQCIEHETRTAIQLAETQGGRVDSGVYIPGSDYAPSSSHLNFLGIPVPYWYYLSGNGLIRENAPTKTQIEQEIADHIEDNLNENCNLEPFYEQGFDFELGEPNVKVAIEDESVNVDVNARIVSRRNENSAVKTSHSVEVSSKLGKLYDSARKIYDHEKKGAFLENYSLDTLLNYAPVDGVEISCSGRIWKTREVVNELKSGLEANIASIKLKGDYYSLSNKDDEYFVEDLETENQVNFLYFQDWPTKVEIYGSEGELMIAEPVGNQEGMGIMGFCYAPYHFVYDLQFPVLVQVMEGDEIFQFPIVVIIDNNLPREGIYSELPDDEEEVDICQFKTQDVEINVYDNQLNKINANISYSCFTQQCALGETTEGVLEGKTPACVNGYLKARAGGYAEKNQLFSSNEERFADIILDREYENAIELEIGGRALGNDGTAIIIFTSGGKSVSTALPDGGSVKLSEGLYNITVYAYGNSSLTIPSSTKTQCTETARGGLFGLFGGTETKCFDITIPETKLEYALIGGGKSEVYLLPSDLEKGRMNLKVDALPNPDSIEKLQTNYAAFDGLEVAVGVE